MLYWKIVHPYGNLIPSSGSSIESESVGNGAQLCLPKKYTTMRV